jgi:hypothetical protein
MSRMSDGITVREVECLFREHFDSISISIGDAAYGIENYHPNGISHVLYVFGGIREFIEEFIPYVEKYPFEESVRNGIIDRQWIEHTFKKLRDDNSLERMIRKYLTDPDGRPDGQLCRFVVAMLRARDLEDEKASVSLADLRDQPCLEPFGGEIGQIAIGHEKEIIAIEPGRNRYRLRVLIPLFSRGWWEPYRLGW